MRRAVLRIECLEMTEGQTVLEHPLLDALNKISSCPPIATADSLRNLLGYLVRQSVEYPGEPIREAQIAGAVFHKTEGFDPRQDSTVRVQTSRLRTKLSEYYEGQGCGDAWILEVPKGSYSVALRQREVADVELPAAEERMARIVSPWVYAAGGFAAGALVTLLWLKGSALL